MLLDERCATRAAAQGLECQGAGAGEQIDRMSSANVGPNQVENGLAQTVFHRPGTQIAAVDELSAAKSSADDSHAYRRPVGPV